MARKLKVSEEFLISFLLYVLAGFRPKSLAKAKVYQDHLWAHRMGSVIGFYKDVLQLDIVVRKPARMQLLDAVD